MLAQEATHTVYKSKLVFGKDWEKGIQTACEKALHTIQSSAGGTAKDAANALLLGSA